MHGVKCELLVFADSGIKNDLLRELQLLNVSVDRHSQVMGMPLRVSIDHVSRSFFEIPLNIWKTNKENMRVTMRFGVDRAIDLDDSTLSEVERLIAQLP